jgi:amino-acid N-acetyltransferase
MTLMIRLARASDLAKTVALLETAGLPVADLSADHLALVAEKDNVFQGAIGIESFERVALLRSLVVSPDARGAGIGPALVTALEVAAAVAGVSEMWLLTIDADPFFVKLGYESQGRENAPDEIRNTKEFSGLCPGDAVLMLKLLHHR